MVLNIDKLAVNLQKYQMITIWKDMKAYEKKMPRIQICVTILKHCELKNKNIRGS